MLTLNYTGLPDDSYTLTLLAGATGGGNFTDLAGNALDGEFGGAFPSGNGTAGGNFVIGFTLDPGTEAFPTLAPRVPPGGLIHDRSLVRAIANALDSDDFTVSVDPGQTISLLVTPTTATLRATVELRDPSGALSTATAATAGQPVFLEPVGATTAGTYTITVRGAASTTGLYTAQVVLNAALEAENYGGAANDSRATAQNIDVSFITVRTANVSAARGAVLGGNPASSDFYSFTLGAGETTTLALEAVGAGTFNVELQDGAGAVLATGTGGASNLDKVISNFTATAAGTYYARVSGAAATYSLVVTRNAAFDTEANDTFAAAQNVSGTQGALGHLGAGSAAAVVGYYTDFDPTPIGPAAPIIQAGLTPLQIMNITTFDLSTIDVLMVDEPGLSGITSTMLGRLSDIQAWVEGGGVFIVHQRVVLSSTPASNPFLVGAPGALAVGDLRFSNDLDVIPPGDTLVTNGPHGTITSTSLDLGGSNGGYVFGASLPVGTTKILSAGSNTDNVAAFSYGLGSGFVYCASVPLDFYLQQSGTAQPGLNFRTIYAPNALAYLDNLRGK